MTAPLLRPGAGGRPQHAHAARQGRARVRTAGRSCERAFELLAPLVRRGPSSRCARTRPRTHCAPRYPQIVDGDGGRRADRRHPRGPGAHPGRRVAGASPATCRCSTSATLQQLIARRDPARSRPLPFAAVTTACPSRCARSTSPRAAPALCALRRRGPQLPAQVPDQSRYAAARAAASAGTRQREHARGTGRGARGARRRGVGACRDAARAVLRAAARTGRTQRRDASRPRRATPGELYRELRGAPPISRSPASMLQGRGERRVRRLVAAARGRRHGRVHSAGGRRMSRFRFTQRRRSTRRRCAPSSRHRRCGGFATFEGWVRDHNEGQAVTALEYEAFEALGGRAKASASSPRPAHASA